MPKKKITFKAGDKVRWYDPDPETRDLRFVWVVTLIKGDIREDDCILLITNKYGTEAEVFKYELEHYR